ncbi:cytochrome c biogenesis heme-transporting ATPase CcmA [Marinomonas spartinae]|uniref:cytochrome c biogenesis heme-transporting ATPase CcmA n=1 Tax=Marinomonas spartinae TaxID=1792290 RepID=UPI0018F154DB|nr:cytochrome c biogenesis heme-transporting ATPase CcmA [Marinomonas spartinae]MBJ7555253.1 cytochrome c biogenesis heme-transporting ATPase CcmA [Marinomonas spartinae]
MQSNISLTISDLWIERGDRDLCKGFSLTATSGDIIHILGDNGAGKSSLFKTLFGLVSPVEGEVQLNGEDVLSYRDPLLKQSLYISHALGLKSVFTVLENIRWYFPKVSEADIARVLSLLKIEGYLDVPIKALSAGQTRRVALARLWLSDLPVWFLDEPFSALDMVSIQLLEGRIREHAEQGGIVFFTSHQPVTLLSPRRVELTA